MNQSVISRAKREYESRQEYYGKFDESYRSKDWARFVRKGEVLWVRKMECSPDDPRLEDEFYFDAIEQEAWRMKMENQS